MKSYQEPSREEIAFCAYCIYETEGRPQGKDQEHWLQAEALLIAERKAQARQSSAKAVPKLAAAAVAAPKTAPSVVAPLPPSAAKATPPV
jgi:hypothetical protein